MSFSSYLIVILVGSIVTWCILIIKRHASIPSSIVNRQKSYENCGMLNELLVRKNQLRVVRLVRVEVCY